MDVTSEIQQKAILMGGSGSARLDYLSPNKVLHFAGGSNNINTAPGRPVTAIPYDVSFSESVGLTGTENLFYKINLDIISSTDVFGNIDLIENGYLPVWTNADTGTVNDYATAVMDFTLDTDPNAVNTYFPANVSNDLTKYRRPMISLTLKNLKSGNQYLDNWLDVRLYDQRKNPIDFDTVYVDVKTDVIVGFHARNTKRIPVNAVLEVGKEFLEYQDLTAQQKLQVI